MAPREVHCKGPGPFDSRVYPAHPGRAWGPASKTAPGNAQVEHVILGDLPGISYVKGIYMP